MQAFAPISKHVIILIDTSGSMQNAYRGTSVLDIAKQAAKYLIATLNPHDKVYFILLL